MLEALTFHTGHGEKYVINHNFFFFFFAPLRIGGQVGPPDLSPSSTTTSPCPPGPPGGPPVTSGTADVMVNFDPDPADVALSSVPGQEAFDPRRHRFSDEELKPQPMIKKARKMLVPDEQKVLHFLQFLSLNGVCTKEA